MMNRLRPKKLVNCRFLFTLKNKNADPFFILEIEFNDMFSFFPPCCFLKLNVINETIENICTSLMSYIY